MADRFKSETLSTSLFDPATHSILELLDELADALTAVTTLEALQAVLRHQLHHFLVFDRCILVMPSHETSQNYRLLDLSSIAPTYPLLLPHTTWEGWPAWSLTQVTPCCLPDLAHLPPNLSHLQTERLGLVPKARSLLVIPIRVGGQTAASLILSAIQPQTYTPDVLTIARLLAAQISGPLAALQVRSPIEHWNCPVPSVATDQLLQSILLAISESTDFESVLREVLRQVCQATDWDYGEVWIPTEDEQHLKSSPIWYAHRESLLAFRHFSETFTFPPGIGLPGRVWAHRCSEWIPDVARQPKAIFLRAEAALAAGLHASLGTPILLQDRVLAVLVFFMSEVRAIDHQQTNLITAITAQLGAVVRLKQAEMDLAESQRRLTNLINSLPGIVFTCINDRHWSMAYLSDGCLKLTGYSRQDLVGPQRQISYNDIIHPEDLPGVLNEIDRAIAQQQPYVVEYRIRTQSGEEKWFWEKGYGVFGEQGQVLGLEGFISDITERKQVEKTLKSQESFLQLVLDTIPQHIFWKDRNLIYQGGNKIWLQSAGLQQPQDAIGKTDYDLWPTEQAKYYREADRQVLDTQERRLHIINRKRQADGRMIWQDISKVPIHDAEGNVIGILGTSEDITERKQAEAILAKREHYLATLVEVQRRLMNFEWDSNVDLYDAVLPLLGNVSGASRTYVFELWTQGDRVSLYQRAVWSSDGHAPPHLHGLFTNDLLHRWLDRLRQDNLITGTTAELPLEERAALESQGILSILILPLTVSSELSGLIGFDNCDRAHLWEASEIDLLRAAAAAISLAQEHRQTKESLREAEAKYRGIFENAVEGIFQTTPEGKYRIVNPMLARLYGYDSPEELVTSVTNIEDQLYVDPNRRLEFADLMRAQGAVWGFESQVYRKDGSMIWISECARALYSPQGQLLGYEGTVEDITQRKHAEAELLKKDNLLQGVADAATCLLTHANFETAIPEALAILGKAAGADRVYIYENHRHPETGAIAMSMRFEWTHPQVPASITQPHWQNQPYSAFGMTRWYDAFAAGQSINGLVRDFPAAEQEILQRDDILAILMVPIFMDNQLWGYVGLDDCRTERQWTASEESILVAIAASIGGAIKRQRTEEQMRYQAFHDALTGLPNRMLFNEYLPVAIAQARRSGETLAVLFLDLDRFKTINDTLGHAVGDQLLQQATQRLSASLREDDIIARWGGDEFTLILPHLVNAEDAAKIASRISNALKPAFEVEEHELYVTCSIGIALYPQDGQDLKTLLQNADAALYRAKDQGRNNYQFYTTQMNSHACERLALENQLHHALELNEFVLHYQPQLNVTTGQITKMEALLRWQHSSVGLISPTTFIPLAEENGLIVPIGEWVLQTACAQTKQWQSMGFANLQVAVNLSARQIQEPHLVDRIRQILRETGLEPRFLELEITETAAMQDVDRTAKVLQELQAEGVHISIDDFGMGYSSLAYLKRFPLHTLKIDQSFVRDLIHSPDDAAIITAILALGRGLNLSVVAEGVETQAQMQQLRSLQCQEMQGYWLSHPLAATAATQFLHQRYSSSQVLPFPLSILPNACEG